MAHVVILGAGASIASTKRNPEKNGKKLPSMDNFVEVLKLKDIINSIPKHLQAPNFEVLYSNLHKHNPKSVEIKEIERRVYDYFSDMELPDEPTIYDYLLLSLRPSDLIATFNWDPFLLQAYYRNAKQVNSKQAKNLPNISFLHGSVAVGFDKIDKKIGFKKCKSVS